MSHTFLIFSWFLVDVFHKQAHIRVILPEWSRQCSEINELKKAIQDSECLFDAKCESFFTFSKSDSWSPEGDRNNLSMISYIGPRIRLVIHYPIIKIHLVYILYYEPYAIHYALTILSSRKKWYISISEYLALFGATQHNFSSLSRDDNLSVSQTVIWQIKWSVKPEAWTTIFISARWLVLVLLTL